VSIKLGVSFKRYGAISGRVRKVEVVMENRGHGEGCYEMVEMKSKPRLRMEKAYMVQEVMRLSGLQNYWC
jgi:hypothetical protein